MGFSLVEGFLFELLLIVCVLILIRCSQLVSASGDDNTLNRYNSQVSCIELTTKLLNNFSESHNHTYTKGNAI